MKMETGPVQGGGPRLSRFFGLFFKEHDMRHGIWLVAAALMIWTQQPACNQNGDAADEYSNPFLDPDQGGKEDTGYINLRGLEVEATLEADVEASNWRILDAPADLAQYAVTYFRTHDNIYLEILAEDVVESDQVEWLVDGTWIPASQAASLDKSSLRHFRIKSANVVLMKSDARGVHEGTQFEAVVPVRPYKVMEEAGDDCATHNEHLGLSQSIYWYLWNPTRSGCHVDTQKMTMTVERVLPRNPKTYPEYDKLWEDGRLDVVVVFGKMDDGDVKDDYNQASVRKLATWLKEAGFEESEDAPLGRRFIKDSGDKSVVVDIYPPEIFHSVADYSRFSNWQKAVSEHEVVMYNGHSVLGSGMAFERADYPDRYQIFQVASCLSYEYYVRPILEGKGGWENVDVVSNVTPTYYTEMLPLTSTILAKLIEGFENGGRTSWQGIMEAVLRKVHHYRFGVSGARGNCFSPEGSRCEPDPEPDPTVKTYGNDQKTEIPDNDPQGVTATIDVPDSMSISALKLDLDITHTWVGDLEVLLIHDGITATIWSREGGSDDDIQQSFDLQDFNGKDASGDWTLKVVDHAARDTGTINSWSLSITPAQ